MLDNYKKFLERFDKILEQLFENQKEHIKCKKGCSLCCKKGDYPFSQIEFAYITKGFINLPADKKQIVQKNIENLKKEKQNLCDERFEHTCPFLINNECCVYEYRGIICRTFGLCYYDDVKGYVRLPGCVHNGLNYSDVYIPKTGDLKLDSVPSINLRIDKVLESKEALSYGIEHGEIRPMLDWLK